MKKDNIYLRYHLAVIQMLEMIQKQKCVAKGVYRIFNNEPKSEVFPILVLMTVYILGMNFFTFYFFRILK